MSSWGSTTWILDLSFLCFGLSWKDFPKWSKRAAAGVSGKLLPWGFKHTRPPPPGLWLFWASCPTKAHAVFDPLSRREQQKDSVWAKEKVRTSAESGKMQSQRTKSFHSGADVEQIEAHFILAFSSQGWKKLFLGLRLVTAHLVYYRHTA